MTFQEELRVRRGEDELTVATVGPVGPLESYACVFFGSRRWAYLREGSLVRWGLTPDGTGVVFEVNDEYVSVGRGLLPPEQRGIFYVRADGSGLRRLGPPSRAQAFYDFVYFISDRGLSFDPSGREFVYVDYGPDESGQEAAQIFAQSLVPGESRRQVTHLPPLDVPQGWPETTWLSFIDEDTILFARWPAETPGVESWMTVEVEEGKGVRDVPRVDLGGGHFIPVFHISGQDYAALSSALPGVPENPLLNLPLLEVFVTNGTDVLQMTNFRRSDTSLKQPFFSTRDGRVYFTASANPLGTNPKKTCQIFSIDPLGSGLRQLTSFERPANRREGCHDDNGGCRVDLAGQNADAGTIFFISNCDPLGQNPYGRQIFAIQPDGSDLRQVTSASGFVASSDGSVEVETVQEGVLIAPRSGPFL
jgi:hypothetical protein